MKKLINTFIILIILFIVSGCEIKQNNMEDIDIYTTNYATEYITSRLYGDHSKIASIYPNGTNIKEYKLTNKQVKDYSSSDLYVFSGLNNKEKEYASKMRDENESLKIIDSTLSMEYTNSPEELWLDPSNMLMMAQNIKKGFEEYIDNYYLNNDINKNYENLKIEASNLDAKIKKAISKADKNAIVATSSMFKFLEKYGLTVYTLENGLSSKDIEKIKFLISTGKLKYIFTKDNEQLNQEVKSLINGTTIQPQTWYTLSSLPSDKQKENDDYFTIMNENIDALKNELYN